MAAAGPLTAWDSGCTSIRTVTERPTRLHVLRADETTPVSAVGLLMTTDTEWWGGAQLATGGGGSVIQLVTGRDSVISW